jgi:hypothetical protein
MEQVLDNQGEGKRVIDLGTGNSISLQSHPTPQSSMIRF